MSDPTRLMRFVLEMRQAGVTDARALVRAGAHAARRIMRRRILKAWRSTMSALPLAHAQTMTKPSVVGRMIAALALQPNDVVLEIGTGSGFQAAALGDARAAK